MPSQDPVVRDLRLQHAAKLIQMAEAGDQAAAIELDRRGIEPPMVELGPKPIESFDIAQEHGINPAWMRQLAITLGHERELLKGHERDVRDRINVTGPDAPPSAVLAELRSQRSYTLRALTRLWDAQSALNVLAASVEATDTALGAQAS